jgi:hypothetical protein
MTVSVIGSMVCEVVVTVIVIVAVAVVCSAGQW